MFVLNIFGTCEFGLKLFGLNGLKLKAGNLNLIIVQMFFHLNIEASYNSYEKNLRTSVFLKFQASFAKIHDETKNFLKNKILMLA